MRLRVLSRSRRLRPAGSPGTAPPRCGALQRHRQPLRRLVDRFVGQAERAPVMADGLRRVHVLEDAHRLFRIDVLVAHEPARLVGADRNVREPHRPVLAVQRAKQFAVAVAGIGDVIELARTGLDDEGAPQGHAPVVEPPRRPVLRRLEMHAHRPDLGDLAPIAGARIDLPIYAAKKRVVAERRQHRAGVPLRERLQRRRVHVVVVIVRDEDRVEIGQIVERDARRIDALRPEPRERAGALRPDGIDQDVHAHRLHEERRVADMRRAQPRALDPLRRLVGGSCRKFLRPRRSRALAKLPAQQVGAALVDEFAAGKKEPLAVEMIGGRAGIIWVAGHQNRIASRALMPRSARKGASRSMGLRPSFETPAGAGSSG